jgi:hypothetical protein
MITRKRFVMIWTGGLVAFAVTLWLHLPLTLETVPQGIVDHQIAGNASRVDYVQGEWAAAGVYRSALTAMASDIAFILLYGLGSLLGGLFFRQTGHGTVRMIGTALLVSALVFLASDLIETTMQIMQLLAAKGDDAMAAIAAAMHYPKLVSWIACFILPLNGLILERAALRTA